MSELFLEDDVERFKAMCIAAGIPPENWASVHKITCEIDTFNGFRSKFTVIAESAPRKERKLVRFNRSQP